MLVTGAEYARRRRAEHPEEARRTRRPVYLPGFIEAGSAYARDVRDPRPEPRSHR